METELVPQIKEKHLQFSALVPLENTLKQFLRTHVPVRESYRLLFISIPVPSRLFVKASQNPPASCTLNQKVYTPETSCMKRTSVHINPLTSEGNCPRPIPNSLAFFGTFQSKQKHKNKPYVTLHGKTGKKVTTRARVR